MRRVLFLVIGGLLTCTLLAQQAGISPVGRLNIHKETLPANIQVVPNSIRFVDATGNNIIDANEDCKIVFQVRNAGKGDGVRCVAKSEIKGTKDGITTIPRMDLPTIRVGEIMDVELPIKSGMNTRDGRVTLTFQVDEPNHFGTDSQQIVVSTRAFVAPQLRIVEYRVLGDKTTLRKKEPFDLQVVLQNTTYGTAENVDVSVTLPNEVVKMDGDLQHHYNTLSGGTSKSLMYSLAATNNYKESTIPILVHIKERYGKYAEDTTITLKLNQALASERIDVKAVEHTQKEIQIVSLTSAVDKNIPVSTTKSPNTFAVVIANENYSFVSKVPYALNDGCIFYEYCKKALGIPEENIRYVPDVTLNGIRGALRWLQGIQSTYSDEHIIVYYAGHGIPDERSKNAYLLPTDGYGSDVTTGYSVNNLYTALTKNPSKSVTIFMDACFSGAKRDGDMLVAARGVAIKVNNNVPKGNMVVFSAATADQTAHPYDQEEHGLFTYFLLKKLQETKGDVSYSDLGDYIRTEVGKKSSVLGKLQTPTVTVSPTIDDSTWPTWKLKE